MSFVSSRSCALAAAAAIFLLAGCSGEVKPEVVAGIDGCRQCGMVIDQPRQACGYIHEGGFVTFDSPVCLLRGLESLRDRGEAPPSGVYFADYRDGTLHPAETVTFLLTEHVPTVMEGGVLAFGDRVAAQEQRRHDDEAVVDWDGFQLARGEPDRVIEVSFGPSAMVPDAVQAVRGELLMWKVRGNGLDRDLVLTVKGYPELGTVTVPASGAEVVFRLKTLRPGAGFPVLDAESGEALGMLKVSGAHTADEEAM